MDLQRVTLHAELDESHWWFLGKQRVLHTLIRELVPPFGGHGIVDLGCGTAGNLAGLARAYCCTGVDPSAEAIRLAVQRFPEIRFVCGPVPQACDARMRQARLFLLTDVLEHVADDAALLSQVLAVARPGAHLVLTVPADPALWTAHDDTVGHYRRYDRVGLARLWTGLPVAVRLLSYYNARLYPIARLVRAWTGRRGRVFGDAGTDFRMPPRPVNAALARIFGGEARVLLEVLRGRRQRGFARGVSLIAVLRREAGPTAPPPMPVEVSSDAVRHGAA